MSPTGGTSWRRLVGAGSAMLLAASFAAALAPTVQAAAPPLTVQILSVNDFHGRIDANTVNFAATIEELRADIGADKTLLLGAGDLVGASLFASAIAKDQPTIDVFNALDMKASAVGNHEFDQGISDLKDRIIGPDGNRNAKWDYLGANVIDTSTGKPALQPYSIFTVNGVSVGVIGAVTQETPTLVSPGGVSGLTFTDPVAAVNRYADDLTDGDPANGEADIVIASYHEGAPTGVPNGTLANQIAASVVFKHIVQDTSPKVSAILNGHTHQAYAWDGPVPGGATRPVLQTGSYAANVGQIVLSVNGDDHHKVDSYTVGNVARVTGGSDPAVKTIVDNALAYAATVGDQPVGKVTADITTAFKGSYVNGVYQSATPAKPLDSRDDRASESALGNLVADAVLGSLSDPDRGGAEIAFVNPGGLRAELLYAGDTSSNPANTDGVITYAEANAVLPFLNNLATVDLTGEQVVELLEEQWQVDANGDVPSRPYLQLGTSANFSYTYDPDPDGDGVTVGDLDDQGRHISSVTINGEPIDFTATYRVGTFTFLTGTGTPASAGGDNFWVFQDATNFRDSGLIDRDAWISYLGDNSPLTPSFAKHGVALYDLALNGKPATGQETVVAGDQVSMTVANLNMHSLGAPEVTSLTGSLVRTGDPTMFAARAVAAPGQVVVDAPVTDGTAAVTFGVPNLDGDYDLNLLAEQTGTLVKLPFTFVGLTTSTTEPSTGATGGTSTAPTSEPTSGGSSAPSTSDTGSTSTAGGTIPTTTGPILAATGISSGMSIGATFIAVLLILAGGALLLLVRRRGAGRRH